MKHFFRWCFLGATLLCTGILLLLFWSTQDKIRDETLKIAIPYEEILFTVNDSDYTTWLSEQIGQPVEFIFLQPNYTDSYLKQVLTDPKTEFDAVFFTKNTAPTAETLHTYIASGGIVPLESWIDTDSVHLANTFDTFADYDLRQEITHEDGHIYYMPALDCSAVSQPVQTMWVNVNLLETVGLQLPSTTTEFAQMLSAFAAHDADLAPIIGTKNTSCYFPLYFLMNSFVTCDTQNHFLFAENGTVSYAPTTNDWRHGLQYCHQLWEDGLIPPALFTYSSDAFIAICNDPNNFVGCFTTDSISSVLSENSPALLSRYLAVPPLKSNTATPVAPVTTPLPRIGGIVLSTSNQQSQVCRLMDLMCSEEGYLRGHYGTPEENWTNAAPEDITVHGDKAVITVTQSVGIKSDTDNAHVIGPYIASKTYADMVAWKGYQVNQSAYLDARAYRTYRYYAAQNALPYLQLSDEDTDTLDALVLSSMIAFVTGEWDIDSDTDWQIYLHALSQTNADRLVAQAQILYQESGYTS